MSKNNQNIIKKNNLVYIQYGKYRGYLLKIKEINNNSNNISYSAEETGIKKVKLLLDEYVDSVRRDSNNDIYNNNTNTLNNNIRENDLVYIPNGKYQGCLLRISELKENGHYDCIETEFKNIKVVPDSSLISISRKPNNE
jgi:ribosomal protein L24